MDEDLTDVFKERPPYQQNDYIGWITQAKRNETRSKRIQQMIEELCDGHVYRGMQWKKR